MSLGFLEEIRNVSEKLGLSVWILLKYVREN